MRLKLREVQEREREKRDDERGREIEVEKGREIDR